MGKGGLQGSPEGRGEPQWSRGEKAGLPGSDIIQAGGRWRVWGDGNGQGWVVCWAGWGERVCHRPPSFCLGPLSGLCCSLRWGLGEGWAWGIWCGQEIPLDGVVLSFQTFLRSRSISSKRTSELDMQNRGVGPTIWSCPWGSCGAPGLPGWWGDGAPLYWGRGQLCGPGNLTSTCYS